QGLSQALRGGTLALAEIGPGQSLGALTRGHPGCEQSQWPLIVMTLPPAADRRGPAETLAQAVGRLWLTGVAIDWPALHTEDHPEAWRPGRVPLPSYPFDRQEHWLEVEAAGPVTPVVDENDPVSLLKSLPLLPDTEWISVPSWRQSTPRPARPADPNWLILTDQGIADELALGLRDQLQQGGAQVALVRPGTGFAVEPDGLRMRPGSAEDATAVLRQLAGEDRSPQRVVHLWSLADQPDTEQTLRHGLHTLIALARAAGDTGLDPWLLDVVSRASTAVLPGDRVHPEQATLLGPCRLIPVEYPAVRTRLIDVDGDSAKALLTELRADPADQVVALRAGQRWLPGYELLHPGTDPAPIRTGGTYLVTGGLGGIGLAMAERLARDYQAKLVLMGRTAVPPAEHFTQILNAPGTSDEVRRRLEGLQRLRLAGAEFVTVAGDVADPADVQHAVSTALARFGELNGILHCAGVPAAGLMQFKTASDIAKVLSPKLAGSQALAGAVRELDLDFLVLFSSTTSVTGGGAGQVDYCAANAFLDAFAQSDPLPGCLVSAIDWGEWTYNGWTSGLQNYDQGSVDFFTEYRATYGVSFEQGWQTLQRVLASGQRHVVISTQDFPTIVKMSRRSSIASHQATVKKARDALGRAPRPELSTAYTEAQTPAEQAIAGVWQEALGLEQVGVHDNFFELGGNSLIGMEIIAEVRKALDIPYLPPHLLYEAPTVATLAEAAAAQGAGEQDSTEQTTRAAEAEDQQRSRIEQRRSNLRSRRIS
ncbi:MAG TPA: SDR family NAD(P)-dependent oxidoreductase, partial [Jatrophihabitans sp.]|nr:SDR family NAD(P)-dependent oxidoreductase [Jatrophihabitans sp.]